ncbi:carbohydrate kinase family protein [Arsenicitalea aurantiaca]|nr:PfkB family carbohydrate kinase [Arsenicitalea aurantiaca]
MTEIATVGWLTLDDIIFEDGTMLRASVGGGVLYSAVGAALWERETGIHAVCGEESWDLVVPQIRAFGIDTAGISPIAGHGLVLWVLNESEVIKQQLPKRHSTPVERLDAERPLLPPAYQEIKGLHVAPQTPFGSKRAVREGHASHPNAAISVDILADDFIDATDYADFAFLHGARIFCPSEIEVRRIWAPDDLGAWARATADRLGIAIAVKLGEKGTLVADGARQKLFHVPICKVTAIDTTGAGDSFCGGLMAGLVMGERPEIAAAMGAVSASYVVEAHGALNTARPDRAAREERLSAILNSIQEI